MILENKIKFIDLTLGTLFHWIISMMSKSMFLIVAIHLCTYVAQGIFFPLWTLCLLFDLVRSCYLVIRNLTQYEKVRKKMAFSHHLQNAYVNKCIKLISRYTHGKCWKEGHGENKRIWFRDVENITHSCCGMQDIYSRY